jgi:hypothetical protein
MGIERIRCRKIPKVTLFSTYIGKFYGSVKDSHAFISLSSISVDVRDKVRFLDKLRACKLTTGLFALQTHFDL